MTSVRGTGSSLRVQGQRNLHHVIIKKIRIIPACAGTTSLGRVARIRQADHPCVCRDNGPSMIRPSLVIGSSLRVQGQPNLPEQEAERIRIIPACAGTTESSSVGEIGLKDHPCVCRDNALLLTLLQDYFGSSLRVQGQLQYLVECHSLEYIILRQRSPIVKARNLSTVSQIRGNCGGGIGRNRGQSLSDAL